MDWLCSQYRLGAYTAASDIQFKQVFFIKRLNQAVVKTALHKEIDLHTFTQLLQCGPQQLIVKGPWMVKVVVIACCQCLLVIKPEK